MSQICSFLCFFLLCSLFPTYEIPIGAPPLQLQFGTGATAVSLLLCATSHHQLQPPNASTCGTGHTIIPPGGLPPPAHP